MNKFILIAGAFLILSCGSPVSPAGGGTPAVKYNEGTVAAPIALTVENSRLCKVGKLSNSETNSYYQFTVPSNGTWYIKASNFSPSSVTGFNPYLYTTSDYSGLALFAANYSTSMTCTGLSSGTTYYLKLTNYTTAATMSVMI